MVDKDEELGNQFSLRINTQTELSGTSQKTTLYFTLSKSTQFVQMNRGGEGGGGGACRQMATMDSKVHTPQNQALHTLDGKARHERARVLVNTLDICQISFRFVIL